MSSPILSDLADKYGYPFTLEHWNLCPQGILLYVDFPIFLGVSGRELILIDRSLVSKKFEQYWEKWVFSLILEEAPLAGAVPETE